MGGRERGVVVRGKRVGDRVQKKCVLQQAKIETEGFSTKDTLVSLSRSLVKRCKKENAQQVAAPDNRNKTRADCHTRVRLAHVAL